MTFLDIEFEGTVQTILHNHILIMISISMSLTPDEHLLNSKLQTPQCATIFLDKKQDELIDNLLISARRQPGGLATVHRPINNSINPHIHTRQP